MGLGGFGTAAAVKLTQCTPLRGPFQRAGSCTLGQELRDLIPQLLGPPRNQDGLTPGQVYFSFLSSVIAGEDCMGSNADRRGPLRVRGSQSIEEPARLDTAPLLLHLLRHEAACVPTGLQE